MPSTLLILCHHQLWISGFVCVRERKWIVTCKCYLQKSWLFMMVCVCDTRRWCMYRWMWEACMCWICACNSACVSECITALCMTLSNDSAIPPCRLWSFICRDAIIPSHLMDVKKQVSLFLWLCTVLFHSLCCTWNGWIMFSFCSADIPVYIVYRVLSVVPWSS